MYEHIGMSGLWLFLCVRMPLLQTHHRDVGCIDGRLGL